MGGRGKGSEFSLKQMTEAQETREIVTTEFKISKEELRIRRGWPK